MDTKTGQEWLKYLVDPDRGYFYNLIALNPTPTTDELINIAFNSEYEDEVCAAAIRLKLDEQEFQKEYRPKLIQRLKIISNQSLSMTEKMRLKTILMASQLSDKINRREIMGKHFTEIYKDAEFFKSIAREAEAIFEKLDDHN